MLYDNAYSPPRLEQWDSYMNDLRLVLPDCPSVTAVSPDAVPVGAIRPLLRTLSMFPSLTYLCIHCKWGKGNDDCTPLVFLPKVRSLRIAEYPPCKCEGAHEVNYFAHIPRSPAGHVPHCLHANLLLAFPKLRDLHLDSPVFLKFLDTPYSLDTLTIEAPPMEQVPGGAVFSTLVGYNLVAGLRQWPADKRAPSTIVIRSGREDPHGLDAVRAVCTELGIELRKEVIYFAAIKRECSDRDVHFLRYGP